MKHIATSIAILLIRSFIPEDGITVSSTHALVHSNLFLNFELKYTGKETTIQPFINKSTGLSPNDYSRVILYDNDMKEIDYAISRFNLSSKYSEITPAVKLHAGSVIKFSCEADTAELQYSLKYNLPYYGVRFKNIRFYKLVYYRPIYKARNSIEKFESPLFSLQ